MQKKKIINRAFIALVIFCTSCSNNNNQQTKSENKMEITQTNLPTADKFVSSPLRNRIKLELNAPVEKVWELVGDPGRMPEYSTGLQKVVTEKDATGKLTRYICHFKPMQEGAEGIIHNINMVWYEPNKGWASLDEEPNAFGLQQSLTLLTFESKDNKTILNWDMHFNSESEEAIKMNIDGLEQALNNDIAQNLIKKFGGKVSENFVDGKK